MFNIILKKKVKFSRLYFILKLVFMSTILSHWIMETIGLALLVSQWYVILANYQSHTWRPIVVIQPDVQDMSIIICAYKQGRNPSYKVAVK